MKHIKHKASYETFTWDHRKKGIFFFMDIRFQQQLAFNLSEDMEIV